MTWGKMRRVTAGWYVTCQDISRRVKYDRAKRETRPGEL